MKSEKKYYKLKLCYSYEKNKKCNKGSNCTYGHGKEDLRFYEKECINSLECFKKDCNFSHPENWNYRNNIKICEYYINGFCKNGDDCEFKHVEEYVETNINKENNKTNKKIHKNLDINNNNEIQKFDIFVNGNKYTDNILKVVNGNENIEIIEQEDTKSNITSSMKVIDGDKIYSIKENKDIVIKLDEKFEEYIKKIKNNIDKIFIGDKYTYGINMKIELNKIMSEIKLFKINYQDIIENI